MISRYITLRFKVISRLEKKEWKSKKIFVYAFLPAVSVEYVCGPPEIYANKGTKLPTTVHKN